MSSKRISSTPTACPSRSPPVATVPMSSSKPSGWLSCYKSLCKTVRSPNDRARDTRGRVRRIAALGAPHTGTARLDAPERQDPRAYSGCLLKNSGGWTRTKCLERGHECIEKTANACDNYIKHRTTRYTYVTPNRQKATWVGLWVGIHRRFGCNSGFTSPRESRSNEDSYSRR
jgi:hypothetical protein